MFRSQLSQFFPPKPAFTEADVAPQKGRVFLMAGGASGIGLELAKIPYQKGRRVYIAGRSEEKPGAQSTTSKPPHPHPPTTAALTFYTSTSPA
jgi:hypothetical protein